MTVAVRIEPAQLIDHLQGLVCASAKITSDTRQIKVGDIFFAYPVGHGDVFLDNRKYISAALEQGAAAVVFDPQDLTGLEEYILRSDCYPVVNLAKFAGELCAEWYGFPSKQMKVIGVTGTNGKTSITQWLAQALDEPGNRAAVMGTMGFGFPGHLENTGYTTPDAPRLQSELRDLHNAGATRIAMEVSSHALEQDRIAGVQFHCAVFTNLTQDHLDYHVSMTEYAAAKAKLFQQFSLEHAVLNFDDSFGRELATQLLAKQTTKVWGFSLRPDGFNGFEKFSNRLECIYAEEVALKGNGYECILVHKNHDSVAISAPVIGEFNLSNFIGVWTTLLTQGMNCSEAAKRLKRLVPVPGRMEIIHLNKTLRTDGPLVVVDYAHTPDALEKVLIALRPIAIQRQGSIWCVFGCGGDRDVGKRSLMGKVAQNNANHVVITSDNPRSENPDSIIAMIQSGMDMAFNADRIQLIPDRAAAIMAAVRHADVRDVILVAGKGHESTQEINGKKFDFSDQAHIQLAAGGMI